MKRINLLILLVVLSLVLLANVLFSVKEGRRALVLRLGQLKQANGGESQVMMPGLHFKMPLIDQVRDFDIRLQTLNVASSRILTAEQKYVLVDYYTKWRVSDLTLYYKRTDGLPRRVQALLQQKINDALRAAFGRRKIKDVISDDRLNIMNLLRKRADESAKSLGIEVVDVRIMGIDLPKEVRDSVFERMRTEREQVATKHRSQGKAVSETIRAGADMNVSVKLAQAKKEAEAVRAKADKEASLIYANAYGKNPELYAFYRSLQSYQAAFSQSESTLVMRADSPFLRYFHQMKATH